jgi:hypothetical protein
MSPKNEHALRCPPTPDAGQVALASHPTVAGWLLFVTSLLAGGAAVFLGKKPRSDA